MLAYAEENAVFVHAVEKVEDVEILIVPLAGKRFSALPSVVVFDRRFYGRTGWNSDKRIAYYRSDAPLAFGKVTE